MAKKNCLNKIIKSIDHLPPFPEVVFRVLEIARDPDADADAIVSAIQYDPAATANCMRLCNSSYFGLREKVQSIRHAVVLLGTDTLVRIVIADSCRFSAFSQHQPGYGLRPGELWRHSVASALVSQNLSKRFENPDHHEIFTTALLHDIGKLIIDRFIADDFEAMFQLMQEAHFGMVEAEKAHFGIDHAEIGALLAKAWHFPESMVDAIRYHHRSIGNDTPGDAAGLASLSNLISHIHFDARSLSRHAHVKCGIDPDVLNAFSLSEEDVDQIGGETAVELKQAGDLLKLSSL